MSPRLQRHRQHQNGASTVEFIVLALALVPFMLIVPLLGAYADMAQATTAAARYVAFEGVVHHSSSLTGWKSDADLATEVRRRFFSNSAAPIKTGDAAGEFNAHRNPLWYDHKGNPLIAKFDDIGVSTEKAHMSQPFGALASAFDLPQDNVYTGTVSVKVADVPGLEPFDKIGLKMTRSATLLADGWAARGPDAVTNRIRGSDAAFPYKSLTVSTALITPWVVLLEPNSSPPDIGRVEADRVPADRLEKFR